MGDAHSDLGRAETLAAMHRWEECASVVGRIIARTPGDAHAMALLARCHLGLGNDRTAKEWAERASAADPVAEWPHRIRSIAALNLGQKRVARDAAREAVRLAPQLPEGYVTLAHAQMANRRVGEAEDAVRTALELDPVDPSAHNCAGLIALKRRKPKQAEQYFREALALNPEDASAMNNIGLALERQGNKRAAIHYYAEASKLDPRDDTARSNATRAARIGAGGAVATVAITRVVINLTSDADSDDGAPPGTEPVPVPIAVGPDGVGVPITLPPRPSSETASGAPSAWLLVAVLALVAGSVALVALVRRRRMEERSQHPLASRALIREIRRNDRRRGIQARGSWLGIRAVLSLGLLVTISLAWAGFASISSDGASGWIFGLGGMAASAALVWISLPRLRRTR